MGIFDRSEALLGADALNTLKSSHVAVFGVGGVGSYTVEALVRGGIGRLSVFDGDTVTILIHTYGAPWNYAYGYGVYAKVVNYWGSMNEIMEESMKEAKEFINLNEGDNVIITGGFSSSKSIIPTNLMKIETI